MQDESCHTHLYCGGKRQQVHFLWRKRFSSYYSENLAFHQTELSDFLPSQGRQPLAPSPGEYWICFVSDPVVMLHWRWPAHFYHYYRLWSGRPQDSKHPCLSVEVFIRVSCRLCPRLVGDVFLVCNHCTKPIWRGNRVKMGCCLKIWLNLRWIPGSRTGNGEPVPARGRDYHQPLGLQKSFVDGPVSATWKEKAVVATWWIAQLILWSLRTKHS